MATTIETPTHECLLDLLALAADAVERFIDEDPEAAGGRFISTGCNHCTEGNTPASFDRGLCWLHQAKKILRHVPRDAVQELLTKPAPKAGQHEYVGEEPGMCWFIVPGALDRCGLPRSSRIHFQPPMYRIEKRKDDGRPTEYWSTNVGIPGVSGWLLRPDRASTYTEAERTEIMLKTLHGEPSGFPEGGIWVRVEG